MMVRTLCLAVLLVAVLSRCEVSASSDEAGLHVRAGNGVLELDNRSGRAIHYRVLESELASRVRVAPCVTDAEECETCPPNSVLRFAYADIPGYSTGAREAVVLWWYAPAPGGGSSAPATIRSIVVPL